MDTKKISFKPSKHSSEGYMLEFMLTSQRRAKGRNWEEPKDDFSFSTTVRTNGPDAVI